jgi:type II secretion system protein J
MRARKKAFTLVEVLVASTIGAFIALVAMGALKAISLSSEMTHNSIDSASEVRFAMNMIARDLMNFYRDKNTGNTKLVGKIQESGQKRTSIVALYTISRTKARFEQPEGDVYEVEYILVKDEDKSILYRRYWPNPR